MSAPSVEPPRPAGRRWGLILGSALVAALLSTFFFSPRFVVWQAFGVPGLGYNIEIFRSPFFLNQVAHPFAQIDNPSNQVIQWRLLFPLLAHYLHLPLPVLLALPWIGCLLALVTVAGIIWRETGEVRLVWLGTLLLATCSWYFVGTGWVLYFDGWLVMALLLATFGRGLWPLLLSGVLAPWIDERFVLALPLCVTVRWVVRSRAGDYGWRQCLRDTGWLAAGVAPYLAIRLWALEAGIWAPMGNFFQNKMGFNSPLSMSLDGAWLGLRAAWIPVVLLPVWLWRRRARAFCLALLAVLFATLVVNLGLAGDLSRSASVAVPALLAGLVVWPEWRGRWASPLLVGLTAANFLLPAAHLVTVSRIPVYYLYTELSQLRQPPDQFNSKFYNAQGIQQMQALAAAQSMDDKRAKAQAAYGAFSTAIGLDPGLASAYSNRGVLLYNSQQKTEALADFNRAVELDPQLWDARLSRAIALSSAGQPDKAVADLEYLIGHAPADWPNFAQARQALAALTAARRPGQ